MASWRSGYAADCKSREFPCDVNDFPPEPYPDKTGTTGERDTFDLRAANRAWLIAAIEANAPADVVEIAQAALDVLRPGQPVTTFRSLMDEAGAWAAFATTAELKCYCLAAFRAMSPADRAAFLAHIASDRRAAA